MSATRRLRSLAVCAGLLARSAEAQLPYSDAMVQPPQLAAPERGSLAGQYSAVAFGPADLVRGGFSLPSPFRIPTERGSPGVDAFPQYSPESGLSEWGLGWNGSGLALTRWRPVGDLDYASDDLTGPWGHLVRGSDGAFYARGLQALVRVDPIVGGFVATLGDGSQWTFDARVDTPSGTYAWYVTSVVTATGRSTRLAYLANASGRLFLSQVSYGGVQGLPAQHRIDLAYEPLAVPFTDYRSGSALALDRRVSRVTMSSLVAGVVTERWHYIVTYQGDGLGPAFFLAQVQRTFASGAAEPAMSYDYAMAGERFASVAFRPVPKLDGVVALYGPAVFQPNRAALLDDDLDGRSDFESATDQTLFKQLDGSFAVAPLAPAPADAVPYCRPAPSIANPPRLLAQVSASDPSHQVVALLSGTSSATLVLCNRLGQPLYSQALNPIWRLGPNTRLVDVNRDHQPDLIRVFSGGYQVIPNVSTAAGFAFGAPVTGTLAPALLGSATWLQDMNGDGIPDLVERTPTSLVVWMGKGHFQFASQGVVLQLYSPAGTLITNLAQYELTFVDVNKDGITDVIAMRSGLAYVFMNTGTRLQQITVPGISFVDPSSTRVVLTDVAGSGDTELALVKAGRAWSLALAGAETALLRTADDGKGNVLRFAYGRGPATAGTRSRQAVLSTLTVETTGHDAVVHRYDYGAPTIHGAGWFLVGFGSVGRQGAGLTWTETFLNSDAYGGVPASTLRHDDNAPQADAFEQRTYEDALYLGIPWKRLKVLVAGVQSPDRTQVASERTDYLTYDAEVCPGQVRRTGAGGTLSTVKARAAIPGFGNALHCLSARVDLSGTHADATLDFTHTTLITRNAAGQLTQLQSLGPSDALTVQTIGYNPDSTMATAASPATGVTTFTYDPATRLLAEVDRPDGVVTKVLERDPLTDAVRALQVDRGGTPYQQFFRYDALERLTKRWNNLGSASELDPNELLSYRYASGALPASLWSKRLVDPATGAARTAVDYVTGAGEPIGQASAIPEGWSFGPLTERLVTTRDANTHLHASVPSTVDPLALEYAALVSATPLIQQVRATTLGHEASRSTRYHADVQRQLTTTLTVSAGQLVETTTENATLTTVRTLDAAKRVVAFRDQAGVTWGFTYDALRRLRRVALPDGSAHAQQFDAHGRVASVTRDGIAGVQSSYDPVTGLLTTKTFLAASGAARRKLDVAYDAPGRKTLETYTDLASGASAAYRYYFDGATPTLPALANDRGQLSAVTGPGYARTFLHRPDGLVSSRRTSIEGFPTVDVQFSYFEDDSPRARTVSLVAADNTVTSRSQRTYGVDPFGRPVQLSLNGAPLASLAYDGNGLLSGATFTTGDAAQLDHDPTTRMLVGLAERTAAWTSSTTMRFNARGLVGQEALAVGPTLVQRMYGYSDAGYLTSATDAASSYRYDYDSFGLSSLVQSGTAIRLISARVSTALSAGGMAYVFDDLGRVATRGDATFAYGPDGNLVSARRGTSAWTFRYDENGQRIAKLSGGVPVTAFVEDGVLDASGLREPLRLGRTVVGLVQGGSWNLVPLDARGTTLGSANGTPSVASPFGERGVHPDVAPVVDFVERGYDADVGLVRMGARDYDPYLDRFLTPDPLFLESPDRCLASPVSCNLYAYARNAPTAFVDPDGLEEVIVQFRAFIPSEKVAGFYGDNRTFSADPNASSRVSVTMKIETDPVKNGGQPLLQPPRVDVGATHPTFHLPGLPDAQTSTGPIPPEVAASQKANGDVVLHVKMAMRNPYSHVIVQTDEIPPQPLDVPLSRSIRADVDVTVAKDASTATVAGKISGSPSFEANFFVDSEARQACFAPTNLPIQEASPSSPMFLINLQTTSEVSNAVELLPPP